MNIFTYDPFLAHLTQRLENELPGLTAQMTMAPVNRLRDMEIPPDARKSGVLVLLYPDEQNKLHTVYMKRTEDGRVHGGQISFPGGRYEEYDQDLTQTALREAEEEVGVTARDIRVVGQLSHLYIAPSNSWVLPTVGFLPQRPHFQPEPSEVAQIIEVEVAHLLREDLREIREVRTSYGINWKVPGFDIQGHWVWGATAMMTAEMVSVLKDLEG